MPAKSRKQQRYLYARFGSKWVHEHGFDSMTKKHRRKAVIDRLKGR